MATATYKAAKLEPDCEERPFPLTSLMTTLRNTAKNTGPSTVIPLRLLLTVLLMSARSDVPVAAEQDKYRLKILQVLKEVAPEVDPELILQQLSGMETDDLVDCSVEVVRKYRELEEENENYRKRKDAFVTLYQKEQGRVKELEVELAEVMKEMDGMGVKHQSELVNDQIRQEYLNEKRRLQEECAELRVCLEHMKQSKDEWTKEKQNLLQKVKNEKLQLSEKRQSKEVERTPDQCEENGTCRERRRVETHSMRVHQKRATMDTCEHNLPCSKQVEEDIYDVPVYPIMHPETTWLHDISSNSAYHTSCHGNELFYSQESLLAYEYLGMVANGNKIGYPNQFISMEITDGEDLPPPVEECGCMNERGLVEDSGYEDQLPIQETGHTDTQEMVTGKNSS